MKKFLFGFAVASLFAGAAVACELGTKAALDVTPLAASKVPPVAPAALNPAATTKPDSDKLLKVANATPAVLPCGSNCGSTPSKN